MLMTLILCKGVETMLVICKSCLVLEYRIEVNFVDRPYFSYPQWSWKNWDEAFTEYFQPLKDITKMYRFEFLPDGQVCTRYQIQYYLDLLEIMQCWHWFQVAVDVMWSILIRWQISINSCQLFLCCGDPSFQYRVFCCRYAQKKGVFKLLRRSVRKEQVDVNPTVITPGGLTDQRHEYLGSQVAPLVPAEYL